MQFAQRQRWRPVLVAVAVGLLLGFAGPFGSYPAYPTATRYAFWLGLTAAGGAAAIAADALLARPRGGAVRIAAIALLSALPMTFVVSWAMSLAQPGRAFAPQQLPALFAAVTAVQLLVAYAMMFRAPATGEAEAKGARPAAATTSEPERSLPDYPPALRDRLPRKIGDAIIALETEDHYLRVHTADGSTLILLRMADAVALIDPRLGAQVHRRWWVADAAVTAMRTEGHKLSLFLVDNTVVPVGRTFAAVAKARFARPNDTGVRTPRLTISDQDGLEKEPTVR